MCPGRARAALWAAAPEAKVFRPLSERLLLHRRGKDVLLTHGLYRSKGARRCQRGRLSTCLGARDLPL